MRLYDWRNEFIGIATGSNRSFWGDSDFAAREINARLISKDAQILYLTTLLQQLRMVGRSRPAPKWALNDGLTDTTPAPPALMSRRSVIIAEHGYAATDGMNLRAFLLNRDSHECYLSPLE
ncbi:hypothetical protein GCM10008174_00930 [Methylopila turkensis]|uniref:Uncharacterized protein n=2 Tax=Methylopila turkensis TaxID=1437816 RepID=A0A9W6JJU6_9HYPH|nr:hypothetical protein GCM10008174_00930 [Methylopila turkensis]